MVVRYTLGGIVYFVCRLRRHCRYWEGATTPAMPTETTSDRADDKSMQASYR